MGGIPYFAPGTLPTLSFFPELVRSGGETMESDNKPSKLHLDNPSGRGMIFFSYLCPS